MDSINQSSKKKYTINDFQKIINKYITQEWLCYSCLGDRNFRNLKFTQKGMGVAISKIKSDELAQSRNFFKRISDYIENHKGLFILLGFLITVATFTMKFTGNK